MNRKIKWKGVRRATAALLAGLCLLTSTGATAIRADAADGGKKPATAETAATPETAAPADLSERAQAFIDAVNALDRDGMVAASNAWGLAHEAWLADPDNAELEAALNAIPEEAREEPETAPIQRPTPSSVQKGSFSNPLKATVAPEQEGFMSFFEKP